LGPYWIGGDVDNWGLDIEHLVEQCYALRVLPRRRLAQLRGHFDALTDIRGEEFDAWLQRLDQLLARFPDEQREAAESALADLGGRDLYRVARTTDRNDWRYGHALPDLLNAWDFAFDLKRPRTEYEE
jgi:hypothetical protein